MSFNPDRIVLGEVRTLHSIEDAVALIDEWIKAYRELEHEALNLRMDLTIAEGKLLLERLERDSPIPAQAPAELAEADPFA